jgi:hypothetical protein
MSLALGNSGTENNAVVWSCVLSIYHIDNSRTQWVYSYSDTFYATKLVLL